MAERSVTVGSKVGLHARPAMLFTQAVAASGAKVTISRPGAAGVDASMHLVRDGHGCGPRRGGRPRERQRSRSRPTRRDARDRPRRKVNPAMTSGVVLTGVGVGRNAVVGPVARAYPVPKVDLTAPPPADPESAAQHLEAVLAEVAGALQERADAATGTLKDVLGATALMAKDPALAGASVAKVRSGSDPAVAVTQTTRQFIDMFTAAGGYMAERATDLASVRDRVVARLQGLPEPGVPVLTEPCVVVAEDLSPADTAALDLEKVRGIVIERGGPTGHTAIIAGQLGLPCVVRVTGADTLKDGDVVAVDAAHGTVTLDPGADLVAAVGARRASLAALALDGSDGTTSDGYGVQLLANIGTAEDAERLSGVPVQGVGLFRTEVLFLDAHTAPTKEDQSAVYARAFAAMGDRKVVLRTLDAGADKPLAFVPQPGEENPALGMRAYRMVRRHPELLRTQLTAIAAAEREGCARLGDGAHDRDRRRGARFRGVGPYRRSLDGRRHGRDPCGRAAGPAGAGRGRLRLDRHQRPGAVHDGGGPADGRSRRPARHLAAGGTGPRRGDGCRRAGSRQARRGVRGVGSGPCHGAGAHRFGGHEPVDVARRAAGGAFRAQAAQPRDLPEDRCERPRSEVGRRWSRRCAGVGRPRRT